MYCRNRRPHTSGHHTARLPLDDQIPEDSIEVIETDDLEENWRRFPHPLYTKFYGDNFVVRNENLTLKVPSAVISGEYNYLINPKHQLFKNVKILKTEPFEFDKRLFEK